MQSPENITPTKTEERASLRRWALGAFVVMPVLLALWCALTLGALYLAAVAWNSFRFAVGF